MIERLSQHHSQRTARISAIVLHDTASHTAISALSWFQHPSSKVSCHYLIDRDGTTYRVVPDHLKAWHCGASVLHGIPDVNQCAIGIELVDLTDDDYPPQQLKALVNLCTILCRDHLIPLNRIVGHEHVCVPHGRKADPGADFPWGTVLYGIALERMELSGQ